jgi:hypothetical protein
LVDGALKGAIEYYNAVDTEAGRLRVRWDVEDPPPGSFPVHGGVVFVLDNPNLHHEPGSPDMAAIDLGGGRWRWHEGDFVPNMPWIMMALILPEGYTIAQPSPAPTGAKPFGKRLALYWKPISDARGNADVEWNLVKFVGNLRAEAQRLNGLSGVAPPAPVPSPIRVESKVVFPLHGIRTRAAWQRAFADVAQQAGWNCRMEKWFFGRFSLLEFLSPWSRDAKVQWLRNTYDEETSLRGLLNEGDRPSVVAHSFGTYILGNALLKYPYLRFDKVILCGSILPCDFPWDGLIERGQVHAVRNECGREDVWARRVSAFVPRTGPSGMVEFACRHPRLEQAKFPYNHSEYFEKGHMREYWIPFLERRLPPLEPRAIAVPDPRPTQPWLLYALYAAIVVCAAALYYWIR